MCVCVCVYVYVIIDVTTIPQVYPTSAQDLTIRSTYYMKSKNKNAGGRTEVLRTYTKMKCAAECSRHRECSMFKFMDSSSMLHECVLQWPSQTYIDEVSEQSYVLRI